MPSQLGKCPCCKCKGCKCSSITQKGVKLIPYANGGWSPAPIVICKKNSIYGEFIFEDSCDCGGNNCCRQKGCSTSILCLDKKYVFRMRVQGCLETSRDGKHVGAIFYRKISCGKKETFTKLIEISSKTNNRKCCRSTIYKVCKVILPKGKYEFKFVADSIDNIDHCSNSIRFDVKWCAWKNNCDVCPRLPALQCCDLYCCSVAQISCEICMPDYCDLCKGYQIIDCTSINVV